MGWGDRPVNIEETRVTVPPRIYPKHTPRGSMTVYRDCDICEKPFDGSRDAVMYGVSGPDGGELQEMAHVACVPELDLSAASTFELEEVGDSKHRVSVARNIAGDGDVELDIDDLRDAMVGKLDRDRGPRPV